jgi:phosphocarrier protein HPr
VSQVTRQAEIVNKYGLHARPAMQFVELANRFNCGIEISKPPLTVDAKSIMSVMRLAATKGTILTINADGEDAEEAVEALANLIAEGFGEMDQD